MSKTDDTDILRDLIQQIAETLVRLQETFSVVSDADYFEHSSEGMEKLDAICMQLLTIGENLKNIKKRTDNVWFENYPEVDWTGFIGLRDILAHAYFKINPERIYNICSNEIEPLKTAISHIIAALNE